MVSRAAAETAESGSQPDAARMRALIDAALSDLDADERNGSAISASRMRVRFEVPDLDLLIDVEGADSDSGHHLRWDFKEFGWEPKMWLSMDADTANAYLQGRESLAIAIARGRVQLRGDSRIALLYLPLLRLIVEPYRRAVAERAPALAL